MCVMRVVYRGHVLDATLNDNHKIHPIILMSNQELAILTHAVDFLLQKLFGLGS